MDFIPKKKDKEGSLGYTSILPLDRVGLFIEERMPSSACVAKWGSVAPEASEQHALGGGLRVGAHADNANLIVHRHLTTRTPKPL